MNKEWKKRHEERSVRESWFFPELVLLFNVYKKKPWITPIKLLLEDLDPHEDQKKEDQKDGKKRNQNLFRKEKLLMSKIEIAKKKI